MKLITIPKKYIASFLALVMVFGVFVFVAPVEAQAVEINANATGFGGGLYYSDESGVTSFANGAAIKVVNLMRTSKNEATYTTTDGTNWTTTDAMVWNSSSKNTFQAWYPVAEYSSYDAFTIPTDQGDATKLASADWMTASTGEIDKPGNGVLDLSFQHRLTKVTVTVSEFTSQYAEGATLSGATIYSLTADNVSVENANNGVTPYQEGNSVTAIVCPGKYNADATLMEINVKDENGDYTLAVPVNDYLVNTGLAAGSHYTFSLKVGKDVVAISSVTVEGWVEMEIDGGVAEEVVNLNIINATVMSTDELNAAVTRALTAGYTDIKVTLAPDAGEDMFQAIAAPIAATVDPSLESWELVGIGTIDLTISGAKTVPEYVFYGVDYGYTEHWAAGPVLRSVTLPDVTEIKNSAFCSCINLISVSAPKCEVIGTNAFLYDESISSIYFPVAKIIGDGAFGWCESLTEISLPEATTLGNSALGICSNLKTAYLPKVTHINGHDAFYDCESLVKITLGAIATVNDSNIGTFKDTPTENIDLVLSPEQKAMTYDSSTKIYTAGTEAFDFGNTNEFVGYTFKSITFVGE